jgi:dihydroneopterin aldolase
MTDDLRGLVPDTLAPRSHRIRLEDFELMVDIGFHDFEVGHPQRLIVCVDVWLEAAAFPSCDRVEAAWDYDHLRHAIRGIVEGRRFNLQETVAREIYAAVAARQGVKAVRVSTRKPDVYPDCKAVGVEIASF